MRDSPKTWLLLTPEYPPKTGGVGDYSAVLADALARAGDRVHVIAPGPLEPSPGVELHPLGRAPWREAPGLVRRLGSEVPRDSVLLVQYVPHAFGARGLNLPFSAWLGSAPLRTFVMVHEPGWPFSRGQPSRHHLLALGQRVMLAAACRGAERVLCSTAAWQPLIETWARRRAEWSPVFGFGGELPSRAASGALRERHGLAPEAPLVVHFGTHRPEIQEELLSTASACLRASRDLGWAFVGRGSETHRRALEGRLDPDALRRVLALGAVDEPTLVAWLAGADVVYLPFSEGVTSRRTTVMNALRVEACVLTTSGPSTESVWRERAAVALYEPLGNGRGADRLLALLNDPEERRAIAARGRATYDELFEVRHTVKRLRGDPPGARS